MLRQLHRLPVRQRGVFKIGCLVHQLLSGRSSAYLVVDIQLVSVKLHYTDTGYGHVVQHHQRTSSQQFYNLLYDKFATSQMPQPNISTCQDVGMWQIFVRISGEFVVQQVAELL